MKKDSMKKIMLILLPLVMLCGTVSAQVDVAKTWDSANTAYINANYVEAIKGYEQLLDAGFESDKLYLNLGNSYFKRGMTGRAILNYNKAQKLSPTDDDIRYNLSIANAYVQDKIDAVPVFFVKRWLINLGSSLSSNAWAVLSLLLFVLLLFGLGVYLLFQRVVWQKIGFYGALLSAILFIFTVTYAAIGRSERIRPDQAVVMSSAVSVKSSPDEGSKDLFVLHEGTKVTVCSALGEWKEIRIADGNKGWIQTAAIELID